MPKYRYAGEIERVYPDLVIPGEGSLVAHPGDEYEGEKPPDPYWWFEVADVVNQPAPAKPTFEAKE